MNSVFDQDCKACSSCRRALPEMSFYRKGKNWKTCNMCSASQTEKRKAESAAATTAYETLYQRLAAMNLSQQHRLELMFHQQEFERHQQHEAEQQQRDPRMTIDYLLADSTPYEPSPLEIYEHHRRLQNRTQEIISHELLQDLAQGANQGMLPDYQLLDPNFYSNLETPPPYEALVDHSSLESAEQDLNFEMCLANALRNDITNVQIRHDPEQSQRNDFFNEDEVNKSVESMFFELQRYPTPKPEQRGETAGIMDVGMISADSFMTSETLVTAQEPAPTPTPGSVAQSRLGCNEPPSFSLDVLFTDFNASNDILRQPVLPNHDLTGEAQARHLISELGLALRLSELHRRWTKKKQNDLSREIDVLDKLEEKEVIVPWGPLSDWLVMYQNGLETILDRYGHGSNLDFQTRYKVRADKYILFRTLKDGLRDEARRIYKANVEALLKLLVEFTGETELRMVKTALDKQLRRMQAAIARDCEVNGVLCLKVGPLGNYIEG